MTAQHSIIVV